MYPLFDIYPTPTLAGFSSSVVGVTMRSMLVLSVSRLLLVEWRRTRDSTPPTLCYTPIATSEWGRRGPVPVYV